LISFSIILHSVFAFLLFPSFIYRKDLEIAATAGQYIAASYPDADTFLQVFWEEEELHSRILRAQLRHLAQQIERNHYLFRTANAIYRRLGELVGRATPTGSYETSSGAIEN
jgi:hypothetical protein